MIASAKQFEVSRAADRSDVTRILVVVAAIVACTLAASTPAAAKQPKDPKAVSVENIPGVTVENVPGVVVENPSLPVHDLDQPALQPFQASVALIVHSGGDGDEALLGSVPAGKRLVIETVVGRCSKGSATTYHQLEIETTGGGATVRFNVPPVGLVEFARFSSSNTYEGTTSTTGMAFGGAMKLYADPETEITGILDRNVATGSSSCVLSIAGHLVDL